MWRNVYIDCSCEMYENTIHAHAKHDKLVLTLRYPLHAVVEASVRGYEIADLQEDNDARENALAVSVCTAGL